ncbi:MAG: cytochrome c oxidase accessory protein CcoG [Proteobacteria bacterium]|nr:cytochrome c oxidase accessory protein CcoG [Pseudomonadota bacterium]
MSPAAPAAERVTLYERWRKIYPLWLEGGFQRWRRVVLLVLVGVYYAGPWLRFDGRPLFWFNLAERQFTVFGATFWPQEFVLLSWMLMMAAFGLFLVTVLAGRVWCGWACPQTVWTLVYFWIEQKVEGQRTQRLRLDRGPWNRRRVVKKLVKWGLWGLVAFTISFTFVAYFLRPEVLVQKLATGTLAPWEQFWLALPAAASFLFSGVLREQVCFHMCPYARFQSVMFDRDTLIISYDEERGEPRGHRSRRTDAASAGLGACIDCNRCVQACPTDIDIRDGLQYQCIACAACIDACNDVMHELGAEPNLIRYSSQHRDQGERIYWLRPRLAGYGAVLLCALLGFGWTLENRVPLELDIIRDRGRLYREIWDGSIENTYSLRITNREQEPRRYAIRAEADFPLELAAHDGTQILVAPGEQKVLNARLTAAPSADVHGNHAVRFVVETLDAPHYAVDEESRFLAPRGG